MSTVGASSNNPYAYLQTVRRQGQAQSNATQSDSQSQQFTVTPPQGARTVSAPSAGSTTATSSGGATSTSGGTTFPRYEPQTLQALLALQSSDH